MPPKQYHSKRPIYCAVIGCPEFGKSQRADNFKKRHCLGTNLNCPIHQEFYPEYYGKEGTNVADDYHLVILESVQNAIPQVQNEPDLIDEMLAVNEEEQLIIEPPIPLCNYDTIDISLFSMAVSYHGTFYRFGFVFMGSMWYLSSLPFQVFMQRGEFGLVAAFYTLDAGVVHSSINSRINSIVPEPLFAPFINYFWNVYHGVELEENKEDWHIPMANGSKGLVKHGFFLQRSKPFFQLELENEDYKHDWDLQMLLQSFLPFLSHLLLAPVLARTYEEEKAFVDSAAVNTARILATYNEILSHYNEEEEPEEERFVELPIDDDVLALGLEDFNILE